ncbi:MAG TPA: tetratricopeptide repeat protein, partial [bacterium]|nr:tetratricopeptide repeat protein [bacterium]
SRESRDRYGEAAAANVLGLIALSEGDVPLARERFRRALDAARELKRHRLAAACLSNLGRISEQEGDLEGALSSYIMAHSEDRLVEHAPGIGEDLFRIGRVLFRMDKMAEARGYLERALAVHTQLGLVPGMIGDLELLTGIAEREGDPSRAAVLRKRLSDIREGMAGGTAGSNKKGAR